MAKAVRKPVSLSDFTPYKSLKDAGYDLPNRSLFWFIGEAKIRLFFEKWREGTDDEPDRCVHHTNKEQIQMEDGTAYALIYGTFSYKEGKPELGPALFAGSNHPPFHVTGKSYQAVQTFAKMYIDYWHKKNVTGEIKD